MTYELLKRYNINTAICDVLDVPFNNITKEETLEIIEKFDTIPTKDNLFIVTANPEITYMAKKKYKLYDAYFYGGLDCT